MTDETRPDRQRGFLGFVERAGNLLPDPTIIFVYLILALMLLSALGAAMGWQASLPYSGTKAPEHAELANGVLTYRAASLFSQENIATLGTTDFVYADGETLGVITEGVFFGAVAGAVITAGGLVWWNPADNTFRAATGSGFMLLPGCRYDQSSAIGEPVIIRADIQPDSAAITAA